MCAMRTRLENDWLLSIGEKKGEKKAEPQVSDVQETGLSMCVSYTLFSQLGPRGPTIVLSHDP